MRKLIVHYHLFKNAGSSVDAILRHSFGQHWISFDKSDPSAKILPHELDRFIDENPSIRAISSHHALTPLPLSDAYEIFPLVFIRHPIARAKSAYLFEWQKQLGLERPKGSFSDYVQEKVLDNDRGAISNFHVCQLSNVAIQGKRPVHDESPEARLARAKERLDSLPFFGLVEFFQESLVRAHFYLKYHFPELNVVNRVINTTQKVDQNLDAKLVGIRAELGAELYRLLEQENKLDLEFYKYARQQFFSTVPQAG
ncbi:sulfotransferase family 2 domain-containing protein [Microbulbifer sp. YPW16]|uniref:sulfotransferase family 2 domain-containing protein n=1 Tax=Microbulbifer sp. YPW16 TaxID=2904242 RepID=UPI001E565FAC|nr:sulfotransferase family 2 domain-containing protein [Microbulbifer sp. YPW16]UHQ55868.1 sulfotransferase family 2 domain-containing protein [Microbulbifer sp. YPW16]